MATKKGIKVRIEYTTAEGKSASVTVPVKKGPETLVRLHYSGNTGMKLIPTY